MVVASTEHGLRPTDRRFMRSRSGRARRGRAPSSGNGKSPTSRARSRSGLKVTSGSYLFPEASRAGLAIGPAGRSNHIEIGCPPSNAEVCTQPILEPTGRAVVCTQPRPETTRQLCCSQPDEVQIPERLRVNKSPRHPRLIAPKHLHLESRIGNAQGRLHEIQFGTSDEPKTAVVAG